MREGLSIVPNVLKGEKKAKRGAGKETLPGNDLTRRQQGDSGQLPQGGRRSQGFSMTGRGVLRGLVGTKR